MLIQCKYCGSNYSDTLQECPNCGAANDCVNRTAAGAPRTVDELLEWAEQHHLPLEQMRTYIGRDVRDARAYGIYKDPATGEFVVYKNKSDGSRAERYRGKDEAYAVNELYQKMKTRIAEQKAHQTQGADDGGTRKSETRGDFSQKRAQRKIISTIILLGMLPIILTVIFQGIILLPFSQTGSQFISRFLSNDNELPYAYSGYYSYGSDKYYRDYGAQWYIWNDRLDTWSKYDADADWELFEDYKNYYEGSSYDEAYGASDWQEWYDNTHKSESHSNDYNNTYDSDWDSDYDWDSGSDWDSGLDDWDSDW